MVFQVDWVERPTKGKGFGQKDWTGRKLCLNQKDWTG